MSISICVNGRGSAWPLELGATGSRHAQLMARPDEYANTSLSILAVDPSDNELRWEILFDVGQGIVPALIQHRNRLPDAVILSHSHFDHVAGLDWLVACQRRRGSGPLPVYATMPCWRDVMARFGWLQAGLELRELLPGQPREIREAPGLHVTAFPVFHGDWAPGACMVMAELEEDGQRLRAVLSGDLLCPLLREKDIALLKDADVLYVDANTRFPCPKSGHWSIVSHGARGPDDPAAPLETWAPRGSPSYLVTPHSRSFDQTTHRFLDDFLVEVNGGSRLLWSIKDFVDRVTPRAVQLVHYSGYEDKDYNEAILPDDELLSWVVEQLNPAVKWRIPRPGNTWDLTKACNT